MRVLVVEDDSVTRRILGRLVASTFGAEVIEAANGMEGLRALEADLPDLVITDVNMPIVDGLGMLKAMRASSVHAAIPVVAVSSSTDRDEIAKLIGLGITEYLLKPLDLPTATKRLGQVVRELRARPNEARPRGLKGAVRSRLLIADPDPNFRDLFKSFLSNKYEILESASGPQALALAAEHQPRVVCLAGGLGLLDERQLTAHLRALAYPPKAVYLLLAGEPPDDASEFDGVLRKSFVPAVLASRWQELTAGRDFLEGVTETFTALGAEVVTAVQQTFGALTHQDVERLPDAELADLATDAAMVARLMSADANIEVMVVIASPKEDAERLAGLILGNPATWDEGANDAFGTLVETLAGRIRASFESRSITFEQAPVETAPAELLESAASFRVPFRTAGGDRFVALVTTPRFVSAPPG